MENTIGQFTFIGALRALADLMLPRVCVACGCRLESGEQDICSGCLDDIPLTYYWLRSRNPMADSLNSRITDESFRPYSYAAALFFYRRESGYSNITKALKYGGNFSVGRRFGSMLGKYLAGAEHFSDVDTVVPVPLHWTRRFKRGYNQAEVIAGSIAKELGAGVSADLLVRRHRTATQTHLDKAGKISNVSGAFATGKIPSQKPSHILVVDDVCTTGATLAECHKVLSEEFGQEVRISVATLGCLEG